MNEVQRQAYLKVMGIQTYFPKSVLQGAKQSPRYEFGPEDLEDISGSAAVRRADSGVVNPQTHNVEKQLPGQRTEGIEPKSAEVAEHRQGGKAGISGQSQQLVDADVSSGFNSAPEKLEIESDAAIKPEVTNELRFELRYFRISEELAVIDEVPHQQSDRLNGDDLVLLRAILVALKQDVSDIEFRPESFSWPLAENLSMKNEPAEEAARALSGFIQMRQETDRFANLLVFAAQAESFIMPAKNGSEKRDFEAENSNYFITVSNSLHSMLAYPALKRDAWQHLQPLRRRLAESN